MHINLYNMQLNFIFVAPPNFNTKKILSEKPVQTYFVTTCLFVEVEVNVFRIINIKNRFLFRWLGPALFLINIYSNKIANDSYCLRW